MKRVRVQRLAGQLLPPVAARPLTSCAFHSSASALAPRAVTSSTSSTSSTPSSLRRPSSLSPSAASRSPAAAARQQSTSASTSSIDDSSIDGGFTSPYGGAFGGPPKRSFLSTNTVTETVAPGLGPSVDPRFPELNPDAALAPAYPSPLPSRARQSAKLAALHARLGLSQRLPLETLARTLVDASADPSPRFNNSNLAYLGTSMMHFHVSEWLMVKYPRLPMVILYGALKAYAGPQALADIARQWGIEQAAAPGAEVDPGLLQYSLVADRVRLSRWGYERKEAKNMKKYKWRHGISSRVVMDDDFGDVMTPRQENGDAEESELPPDHDASAVELGGSMDAATKTQISDEAHANAVRAVIGAVYAHGGREAMRSFVRSHVLSRQLNIESLFRFKLPTRELTYLCARENFEPPVARLESETGRKSRTPVFVVGIYSGADKLGEGAGASLDIARRKAAMNALKAWYLYSPGENVRVPSDTLLENALPWEPAYVDIGEIL